MDNSKVRKLYDAMSAKYNMTQPYEEFESLLNDEGKRRKVYDAMSAKYNMTQSFDEFNNSLMGNTVDEAVQSNQESINSITPAVGQEAVSPFQADSSYLTDEDRQTIADSSKMSFKEAKRLGQAAMGIAGQRPTADSSQAAADFINTNREAAMQQEETQKLNQQRKTEAAQPIAEGFHELSEVYKDQAKTFREESKQLEKDYYALTQAARDYATSKFGPQPKKLDSKEGWGKAYMEYLENNDPNKVYERYNNQGERSSRNNTISFLEHMANQTERRARQTLRQAERGVVGNTIAGVGYGLSQPQSWSLGMSDLWTAENMISLANKLKDGKQLTDYEQAALDAYETYQEAASILHEYDTRGFKAGVTTGEMAPFMVQMAWNPAGKLGTTLAQKGVRKAVINAAKGSSREAAEAVAEQAMKDYGTMATRDLLRNYGVDGAMARIPIAVRKMGGDLAASAVLANTLQVGSTLNDIAERKYGAPVLDGEHYTFDPEREKSWAEAAYKGELSSIIENFTEMMGEWRVLGLADKMSNFGTKGVGRLVRAMGDTDFAKGLGKVLQDAHWSGTIGEMLEEEYGIILNSLLTGDSKISDLWNLDQQIDIFLGVGLFGGVMGGAKMAAYPLAYVNSKKKLDEVTNYNQDNIADWAKIQDAIDNADNNGLAGIIGSTLRDREEGKDNGRAEAILNYIDTLQHFRGVTIARDMLPADADMKTMQAFYLQGYDGTDKQAISAAYQHRKSQMELMNPGITAILDSEGIDVTIKDENGNIVPLFEGQYRQMALDYLDAKAAYDGMLDGITDRAQSKARAAEAIVRSNDNNGQQIEATTRTGDKVHIISGDVIMADGVANLDQSSKSIVIRHEDGTKEMVSPLFIKSIDLTTDTESAAAMAAQSAAQESVMTESQEAEISNADEGMQAMADNELGQQRGKEQADYQIDDIITLPDGTTGRVNLGIGQTEDGTVEVVWNTPDGNKVGRYTADQLYDMQHPEGTTAAAVQTEQVEATQENTEPTPQQQAYDEWVAKHGDNALNKLNQTRAYAEKELAARQKELNKIQSELNDLPDVEDEAITKKKAELEKKQTELQSAIDNYSVTLDRMNAIQSVYDAQNQESAAEQKDVAIRNRAAEWEKNTGVKVIILERLEDVPNEIARQKIQAGENVKGWFEKGQVYVYLPNNTGAQDFDQTFIHEVIAHKGLKEMLGTQLYAKLCRQVWDQLMTEEQKQEYLALVGHVEGEQAQQLAAADEFIAYFAEKMTLNPTAEDMTTWQQFVKMLTELLNKVFGAQITEQDLSELLIDSLTRYQMQVKSQEAKVRPKKAPKKKVKKVNKPTDFQNMRKAIEDVIDEMDFETQVRYAVSKLGHSIVWGNDPNTGTKGLGSHIVATKGGASEQDRRKYFAWEKSRRNGGKYPEEIAESIMANMPESLTEGYDTRDALRIILDAITGSSSPSDVVHQVYDDLIARQEAAEREEEERQQYTYAKERGFGSYEELVIFDANEDLVPLSEEEWQQYYNSYYEEGTDGSSTQGVQGVVQQPAGQGENLSGGNEVGSEQRSAEQVPSNGRTEAQEGSNPVLPGTEGETGVIQGLEGYSLQDIQDIILNHIADVFQGEFPEGFQINGIGIIGSRANGTAREDSDLDVLLEYEGDISEDALYNMLNGENGLEIEGIKVDINPITPGKSGTIQEFLERNNDYKKDDTQKEAERRDERRQRILKNGTGFEKPFVLSMPRHITTIEEIQRNIGHIIDGLIQHEGDGTLQNFEGFAADGKYSRNAGEQIREYLLSLDGVIPGRLLQLWANSNNLKTYDDIVAYGKKLYEERKKKSEFEREQLPLILEDIGGDQKLAQLMTNDEVADFVRLYESLAPYTDAIGEAYEKYDKDLKSNNKKVQAAARKKIDALKKQREDAFMATLAGVYDSLLKKYGLKEGLTDEQIEAIAFVEGKTPDQVRKEYGEVVEGETPRNTSLDEVLFRIDVNHNSPYLLKKADGAFVDPITGERLGFDNRFMGSGQGSQAHGYGSYFSVRDLREYGGKDQPRNTYLNLRWRGQWYRREDAEDLFTAYDLIQTEGTVAKALRKVEKYLDNAQNWGLGEYSVNTWKRVADFMRNSGMKKSEFKAEWRSNPGHHYDVTIPDNTGTNYLEENLTLRKSQRRRIADAVRKLEGEPAQSVKYVNYRNGWDSLADMIEREQWAYQEIRDRLVQALGGKLADEKRVSELMNSIGFDGIHYNGGYDGECYVIFNPDDAQIVDHVMFRVTPEQDAEYKKAYEDGDTEKATQMVKDAFKEAYPNTKVVDKKGEPMVVYHGTHYRFTKFLIPGEQFNGLIWATDRDDYAKLYAGKDQPRKSYELNVIPQKNGLYPLFMGVEKPLELGNIDLPLKDKHWTEIAEKLNMTPYELFERCHPGRMSYEDAVKNYNFSIFDLTRNDKFANLLKEKGYDGAFAKEYDSFTNTYAAVSPMQVKSAEPFTFDDNGNLIPLSERFNSESDDIRFRQAPNGNKSNLTDGQWEMVRTPEFKEWSGDWEATANIQRGFDALRKLAKGEAVVENAMRRDELEILGDTPEIAFYWGEFARPNDKGELKKGYGFAKIIQKHGPDAALKIVETIARGEIKKPYGVEGGKRVDIVNGEYQTTISLFKDRVSNSWVLTGYKIDNKLDAKGRGSDLTNATQTNPIRTRESLGAALSSPANIEYFDELTKNSTKIVDENGEPKVVYHGTDLMQVNQGKPFYIFYPNSHFGTLAQTKDILWNRTADDIEHKPKTYEVFLNIRNPKRVDDMPEDWFASESEYWEPIIKQAREEGYDGIVYENKWEGEGVSNGTGKGEDSYIAFESNQIKSSEPETFDDNGNLIPQSKRFDKNNNDIRFRIANDRANLMGAHNLSEEKLKKVLKQGGLANPSMAIVNTDKYIHTGYGEISLIPYSSQLDASKTRGVVTYSGDAYSPSYPGVTHKLTGKGEKKIDEMAKRLAKGDKVLEDYLHNRIFNHADDNGTRLSTVYLLDKGMDPDIVYESGPHTHEEYERVKDIIERNNNGTETAEDKKIVLDILVEKENERYADMVKRVGGKEKAVKEWAKKHHYEALAKLTDENGELYYGTFDRYLDDVRRSEQLRNERRIDSYKTEDNSLQQIMQAGLTDDYWKWVENIFTDEEWPEMLFAGFTPAGYRRWIPNTLENASKLMNKQSERNADDWNGWNATKSLLLKKIRTLSDIRKVKDQLKTEEEYNEEIKKLSEGWTDLVSDLSDMQKISDNRFSNMDYAENRLQEAIVMSDPIGHLNREYDYDIDKDSEFAKDLLQAISNMKKAPAKYFEVKYSRPVYLYEFKKAIVPDNMNESLKNALKRAGIQIVDYKHDSPEDRIEKTRQVTEGDEDVRFRVVNENQAIFVSNAEKAVENIKQEKGTPDQWLAMIQKQGGLKAGEDKWMGLSQWLNDKKAEGVKTLTKPKILDFIDSNKIQIEEQRYSEAPSDYDRAVEEEYPGWNEAFYSDVYDGMAGEQLEWNIKDLAKAVELFNNNNSIALHIDIDEGGEISDSAYDEILDWAKQAFDELPLEERGINTTRLSYTTNGLENKREIALWIPDIEPWEKGDNIHFGDAGNGRAIAWIRFGDKRVKKEERDHKVVESFEEPTKNYKGWDVYYPTGEKFTGHDYIVYAQLKTGEMGYVPIVQNQQVGAYKSLEEARVAMNEMYKELNIGSPLYDNILVIDEIQSNRHQEGRERGYRSSFNQEELDQARRASQEYGSFLFGKYIEGQKERQGQDFLIYADPEEREHFRELTDRVSDITRMLYHGIPDAPFEKNWQELAMKRMLRLAAEEGYDKVAWTTGDQQSERYNIGGYLSSIKRLESDDINELQFALDLNGGNSQYIVTDNNGHVIRSLVSEFRDRDLSDIIGKDLADKTLALKENEELDTDDITISNSGMATFYDKMLVNFMNKYGKQWGVKVEDVDIPGISEGNWENAGDGLTMHSINVTDQMKKDVMEGQTMFRIGDNEKTHEMNDKQKQPGEDYEIEDEARFRLSKNNRKTIESWLNKRTDLGEGERQSTLSYIDGLDDSKTQLATGWWFAKGTIRLPEDMPKVEQAVAVSTIAKVDPLNYSSPMELINAHADIQVKDKPINPDEVSTLHKYRELPDGIVVYDVDDSEESRKNMRAIIDTHFGKESSPWCLLQGDGEGNLTEQSKDYWDYYNSYPKQVAFKDGKLQAFSANNGPRRWWDRMDKSHEGIPVEGKMPGDKLGRSAVMEYDPVDGTATVVGDIWKGNPDNGPFETYYDTGELRSRSTRKNHEDVGLVEKWHKNGQKSAEFTNNELGRTDGPAKTWHANGQLSGQGRFRNGYTEGVWESWYENGQKKLREVYPEDILSVSPENRYNRVGPYEEWYENGNKKQYVPIGEDGRVNGTVTNWFEDGTKESEEVRVDSNTRSFIRWFQSGDLEKKQEWDEDGHKTGTWESYRWDWDSNKSVLQERTTYKNGSKNGPDEEYYPNGNIKIRVNFKDGRAEGLTESWNEDGKPFLRLVRIDGKEIGHEYYDYDKNEVAQLYTMRDGAGVPHNYVRRFPMEGYKPLTEEELSTYPDWAREEILADQTMFRVGEEQLNLFSPEDMNGGIAGSQKNINFASNKKSNERGESDIQRKGSPSRADSTGRREDGISQTATSEPAQQSAESVIKPLRKLEEGETCYVERKLSEAGDFSFIGKDKIETIADVAFIFRKLETKAVENAFIAFVKNGKATILHVGMGPIAASLVDLTPITVMMKNINPDKVYFVHNHPSGQLISSNADRKLWQDMKKIMGDTLAPGIIIDSTRGEFGIFEGDAGFNSTGSFVEFNKGEQKIPVYRFDERVFSKDYDPESSQIRTSRDIAAFVAGHRLGERDKISVLCLDHGTRVLGNFFLPYTDLSSIDTIKKIAVDSAYYAGMCGATSIVLYGNGVEPSSTNLPSLAARTIKEFFAHNQLALLDIVGCYRDDTGYYYSYADHGYVAEPGMEYGKQEALKQAEAETDTNPTQSQKEAGNYKKGHVRLFGMDLSIEQPKGSVRSGTDADGKQWSQEMHNTYGYIRGTLGRDKDHVDVFLGDNLNSDKVFVVDQRNIKDGSFDEHKVMLGFDDIDAARKAYESNYEKGWRGMAAITETTLDDFKEWAFADGRRVQPFSQLVKTNQAGSTRKTDAAYAEYDRTRTHGIIAQSVNDDATLEDINKLLKESKEGSPEYDVYNTIYTLAASGLSVREAKDTVINESANATESITERRMEQDLAPVMEPLTQLAGVSFRISREPSRVRSEYNNGDIVVYNPKSAADVQAAVMRESYIHKDIRNVPGWDALTDVAYRLSEGEIASKAVRGNMDFEAATEEWMYENAERMVVPFEVMMSHNRVNLLYRMTGDEIRMYLTKSDGLLGDAELFVTKEELPVEESIRFRRGSSTPPSSAQQLYDASQQSLANKFYRAYVDYTKPLRDVQEIIAKESGAPIQDFENAWEAENQRSSKSKNEIEQFELKYFEDIREAVKALEKKTGMTYNEVLNYLIAKHGLERNVVLAQRDAEADYRDYLKEQPGGPMTVNDFFLKRRKRDYSGLTDLSGKQDVADAEDYARTLVQTVESMASRETDALWQTIKDAVEVIQKKRYQSGMISREQMQKEADMFDNYIPLRGFAETIAEDVYDYYEDKMRNRPQYSRRAGGRSSLADDPLATLGAMAASAIMQGNNNLMKQRFLNMVENHKTDIATIKDVWVVNHGTPSAPVWEPEYPDIHEGMDADDIRVEIERYTNRMQQMQRVGLARKATNRLNIKWRTLGQQAKQHIITVRRNGEEQMIIINGNPQVARTVNGINNPDADLSNFMRGVREVQRFMAANFTTRNPAFVVANLCRDLGFAVMAVSAKENADYRHQFMKNITGPVIKTTKIGKLLRKWQAGTLDVNNELERYFGEFMDNGGETGYTAENTVDAFRKKMMKGLKDKSKATKAAEATLEFFELCNRSVEDFTRFMTYMTSRQLGRTVQRSVADAKNITVNFNRKGSGEMLQKYIASGYLFFNAGVQSLQNVAKISGIELSMDETKGKARIKIDGKKLSKSAALLFGSQVIMGMVFPMLNEFMMGLWGGDDDDEAMVDEDGGVISTNPYRRLTEYERRNNLCLWIGGNRFIKIPLAIELRAFYGLGETIYGYMAGIPNPNPGADILTQIADLLPVNFVENNGLVPDVAAPLWQSFITNENFMGIPLYNDSEYLKNEPEANKVYSNTGDAYIALSRWINELGGGDEVSKSKLDSKWNNPAVMQNIVEGYLGGLLTTSRQTANLIGQPIKKFILGKDVEPIPARDWPVANRLYINTNKRNDDRYVKERYYNYRDQAEKVRHDIRKYEERLDDPKYMEKYQQLLESPEYLDYITFDALNKAVKDAHQDVKEYGDEFKVFETDAMRELVNAMDEDAEAVIQPEQWGRSLSGKDKNISE